MDYQLRMSTEIRDWLAGLAGQDPAAARLVGEALAALAAEGGNLGPPLVAAVAEGPELDPESLDRSYQQRLESLAKFRRRVADAATLLKQVELEIGGLEARHADLTRQRQAALQAADDELAATLAAELATVGEQLSALRRLEPRVRAAEQTLTRQSTRLQARVDAFRSRKESLQARYAAARGMWQVSDAIADLGAAGSDGAVQAEAADFAASAARQFRRVTRELERELPAAERQPAGGLMELRPGAPGDAGIRLLFAVEPPGAALLIAVLDSPEAVRGQYDEAVAAATEVLGMVRDGDAPDTAQCRYDRRSFLAEFFPEDAAGVEAGAAALADASRGRALAQYRAGLGLTRAEVAERMEVPADRVAEIERAGLAAAGIGELTQYIEAMGGRLEITADFGGNRIVLR